jgi:Cd2+/Zn2+-exporting ATPase
MLFYAVGELFQTMAVKRAKANIKTLLDQRPDEVTILRRQPTPNYKSGKCVSIGDIIQLKVGRKIRIGRRPCYPKHASFNTAALTGESKPDRKSKGETVLAGMINLHSPFHR